MKPKHKRVNRKLYKQWAKHSGVATEPVLQNESPQYIPDGTQRSKQPPRASYMLIVVIICLFLLLVATVLLVLQYY